MCAASPSSSILTLHSDTHKLSILHKLDKLRRQELLCDITIIVENTLFRAHKVILAASSEYFSSMFTAEDQVTKSVYEVNGMTAKTFSAILEFIYSGKLLVEESISEQILETARFLKISDLNEAHGGLQKTISLNENEGDCIQAKRKRGRPKKSKNTTQEENPKISDVQESTETSLNINSSPEEVRDVEFNPEEERQVLQKRKIKPPIRLNGFRLEYELMAKMESGKRGRKRKYPEAEARCEGCGKVFKNHLFLKRHLQTHTENKSFSCKQCGKTFSQQGQLKSHSRVHTGKGLPECAQCNHRFMDAAQLKKHMRTHTGEKPFTCEICGKSFTAKGTLQTHIRIHRGEKPYVCNICDKTFSDPSARRRHVASHTGKKPFLCIICNVSFARMDNLKAHIKIHNKEPQSAKATEQPVEEAPEEEQMHSILELQPYQLQPDGDQEIQLVVTSQNINLDQEQSIQIITAEDPSVEQGLTLLTQPLSHVQNLSVVAPEALDSNPQIQTLNVLGSDDSEQMHVITLSKEAMEQLQVNDGASQQLQVIHESQTDSQIHISGQNGQPITISHTSGQIPSHQIQGQTFQIQAGTVSYLYTTNMNS
ncbi:hypothetical protein DNTS_016230 [Danionella cerebrum]|uniref:Zinc finger and BTB domain-containing protein 24 n=1 Tax=Danionella cerebrum TaxID=2873325 RepID=A0A553Q0P3_9TELE|nr:hypothetical protein DNTS_016230 [Danionella translucida]TRY83498.1 hypothetical protein DNTS_016230 [Danionella translucida]